MRSSFILGMVCTVLLVPSVASNHVQSDSGRIIVFDHKTGNEWWVEVLLSGQDAGPVSSVQARDDGGAWVPLELKWWGAWAASFHIEPGHRVQFRASWPGGAMQDSCWFTHPQGVEQCVAPFDATFTLAKGNEWWVQSQVTPNAGHTVAAVDVRLDDGTWRPLSLQSWGVREWAASYHMPDGTKVQLRATDTTGAAALSGCYRWIPPQDGGQDAQQIPCSPPPGFDASFSNVKGNDWWVEVRVVANQPLAGVDARVGCAGSWHPLSLRSWGAWAGSFHIPPGSTVDLRARSTSGASDLSGGHVWPQATPTSACPVAPAWPVPGSFADVRFRAEERWQDVDGPHYVLTDGLVHTEFGSEGQWKGTCEVRRDHQDGSGAWTNVTETRPWDRAPPMGELPAPTGSTADAQTVQNCGFFVDADRPVVGHETRTFSLRTASGDPIPIAAVHAQYSDSGNFDNWWWDERHGLMLEWDLDAIGSFSFHGDGWLLNTDASWG